METEEGGEIEGEGTGTTGRKIDGKKKVRLLLVVDDNLKAVFQYTYTALPDNVIFFFMY